MANADRIIELLHQAKARPAGAERACFLDEACRDDLALKEQIVSLLEADADEGESDFLKIKQILRPPIPPTEKPGDRIGRYKLLEQIGEGGCGVVYMAEQEEPVRRRVALKVIKLGMDTKHVIARFEAERQALALMDHPNIAKVLDGGATETGRPFFVMELVRGIKITDYCDQNNLTTNERLELFIQVCQAVQHAHQKGIIHRDIKPSNILVTQHDDVAVPKVIDFGIAKATVGQLTDKTVFTAFAQFVGTPAYMSPEQAQMSGLDIDTRADIYSLGVLLYELLTGHTPFDAKELLAAGMDEMRRKIREDEPAKPSTRLSTMQAMDLTTVAKRRHVEPPKLIHLIRGDLDWLVMKCLEKDRTRRYETANGLAADIQRHLKNEPVTACPPSAWYEFQKTVRRHKFGFAAAAALIVVLGLGVLASTWQALRATRAEREQITLRKEAEIQAAKSEQVAQFMQDMLKGVGPWVALGRDTTMLREILDKTAQRIADDLKTQPEVEAELRNSIGTVYWELGESDKSAAMHLQALTLQRKLLGNEHPSVATSLHYLAQALREQGRRAESEAAFRESLALRKKLLGSEHPEVARSMNDLASLLSGELKDDEPEALLREALAIRRKLFGNEHPDVARSLDDLAHVLNRHGQATEAIAMHYEALAIRKKTLGETHPEMTYSYRNLASALMGQGKPAEAEAMYRDALLVCQKVLSRKHPVTAATRSDLANLLRAQGKASEAEAIQSEPGASPQTVAASLQEAGIHLQQNGRRAEAEINYREALALRRKLPGDQPADTAAVLNLLWGLLAAQGKAAELETLLQEHPEMEATATAEAQPVFGHRLWQVGDAYSQRQQFADAERHYARALQHFKKLQVQFPMNSYFRQETAFSLRLLSDLMERDGRLTEAEANLRAAYDIYQQLAKALPDSTFYPQEVAFTRGRIAQVLSARRNHGEAEAICREELATAKQRFGEVHRNVDSALAALARVLQQQRKLAEAEVVVREELAMERKLSGDEHLFVANSLQSLTSVLYDQHKLPEAETAARAALALRKKLGGEPASIARSLAWLAAVLEDQGRLAEAEVLYRERLTVLREQLGNEHPDVGTALAALTQSLLLRQKFAEAEPLARECLALRGKNFPDDWRTFNARSMAGGSLLGQKKYAEAEPLLLAAYEGMKQREDKIPANGKVRLQESLQRLVQLYEATGQSEKAAEWKMKLAEIEKAEAKKKTPAPKL